jgi:integrase
MRLFDFGRGVDLAVLRKERLVLMSSRWSANTKKAYAADWRCFVAWCEIAGRPSLPASSDTVQLYLVDSARHGRLPSTIGRYLCAISAEHLAAGFASPVDAGVREVLAGIGRHVGLAPQHAKAALSIEELRQLVLSCGPGPRGDRDRALLLVGFASGLRRSNLAGLDLADVEVRPEGLVLRIVRSKVDQLGKGWEVGVFRGCHRWSDPVRAYSAWLQERGDWAGPLFCQLSNPGDAVTRRRLSGCAVAAVVRSAARRAGLDASRYAGHSLRAGCATAAAANGAPDLAIMRRTGHASLAMLSRYVRHGSLFACDPLAGAL